MELIRYLLEHFQIKNHGEVNSRTASFPILSSRLAGWKRCHPARVRGSAYDDDSNDDDDGDDDDGGDDDDDDDDQGWLAALRPCMMAVCTHCYP